MIEALFNINTAVAGQSTFDAIAIAAFGQSNQQGKMKSGVITSPYNQLIPNTEIVGWTANPNGVDPKEYTTFQPLDPTQIPNYLGDDAGVELSFAYNLQQTTGKDIYIIKVAQDSTGFGSSNQGEWSPNGTLRGRAVNNLNYAINYFQTNNIKVKWHFHWDQWEYDCFWTSAANNYDINFGILYDYIVAQTGTTFNSHSFQKPNPNSLVYQNQPSNAAIIESKISNDFPNIYQNTFILDADDLALSADQVHYNETNIQRGERLSIGVSPFL